MTGYDDVKNVSNVSVKPNVYVRRDDELRRDTEYVGKITGADLLKKIKKNYYGIEAVKLSDVQENIAANQCVCTYAKNGEMSFGPVRRGDGSVAWVNRCGYTQCPRFESCEGREDIQTRRGAAGENASEEKAREKRDLADFFGPIGVTWSDKGIYNKNLGKKAEGANSGNDEDHTEYTAQNVPGARDGKFYEKISNPSRVINAPILSHIVINSAPGSGKTYTVIGRLIYIIEKQLCPADSICVLCRTEYERRYICDRLEKAKNDGYMKVPAYAAAKKPRICTFDSFADKLLTKMRRKGLVKDDDNGRSGGRVNLAARLMTGADTADIGYLIVDGIQDLSGARAQIVIKILESMSGGSLLTGDRCRAIGDFGSGFDSVMFYDRLEAALPSDTQRFELEGDHGRSEKLAAEAKTMRNVLLSGDAQFRENYTKNILPEYYSRSDTAEAYIRSLGERKDTSRGVAFICGGREDAAYVSTLLCAGRVAHSVIRGEDERPALARWLADVFWDRCDGGTMRRDVFLRRLSARCEKTGIPGDELWRGMCVLTETENFNEISVPALARALADTADLPREFTAEREGGGITVATVENARGRQFDSVVFIESDEGENTPSFGARDARARYIAFTRAVNSFSVMKKDSSKKFLKTASGRVAETGYKNMYRKDKKFCKRAYAGLYGDIDTVSFARGGFGEVLDTQRYIAQNVRPFDRLNAVLSDETGLYGIFHGQRRIGSMSRDFTEAIGECVRAADPDENGLPRRIRDMYVGDVTAQAADYDGGDMPEEFRRSGIFYGISIRGLAKIDPADMADPFTKARQSEEIADTV